MIIEDDRRSAVCLSEDQINMIAERAAEKAVEKITTKFYRDIGHTVIKQLLWIIGVTAVAAYFWLQSKGLIAPSH